MALKYLANHNEPTNTILLKGFVKALIACCFFFVVLFAISSYIRFSTDSLDSSERIKTSVINTATIAYDSSGSVRVKAENEHDLAFSLGLIHSENSNWQLFINQQIACGKLSRYFGNQWLQTDAIITAFEIDKKATAIFQELNPQHQNILQAYASGVNTYFKHNQRSLDIRFAKHDLTPTIWQAHTPISLWLLALIIDNPAISQDALIVALGLNLPKDQKEALFQALPSTNVVDAPNLANTDSLFTQLLSLQKYWLDLSIKTGLKSMDVGNFTIAHTGNDNSSIISSRSEPIDGFTDHLAIEIDLSGTQITAMSQIGSPLFWMKSIHNTDQKWSIDRSGDGFHSLNILSVDTESSKRIKPKAVILDIANVDPELREFYFLDNQHFVFTEPVAPPKVGSTALILADRLSQNRLSQTYSSLLDMSFNEDISSISAIPFYEITTIDETQNISFIEEREITQDLNNGLVNLSSAGLPSSSNRSQNTSLTGFLISHGSMLIKNNQRYFKGWRNDPFSLEFLQTELLVEQQLSPQKLMALMGTTYSSFAAKTLIDIGPILANNSTSQDIGIASAYFENWNYLFDENAAAATIFEYFYQKLIENVYSDELSPEIFEQLKQQNTLLPVLALFTLNNSLGFFDNIETSAIETKEEIVVESLKQAMISVRREFGNQTEDWRWENYLARKTPIENNLNEKLSQTYQDLMILPVNNDMPIFDQGHWSTPSRLSFIKAYSTQNGHVLSNKTQMLLSAKSAYFKGIKTKYGSIKENSIPSKWTEINNNAIIRTVNLLPKN